MKGKLIAKIPISAILERWDHWNYGFIPQEIYIYKDRIEITFYKFLGNLKIQKFRKKFNYQDLFIMNEALNKIFGDHK